LTPQELTRRRARYFHDSRGKTSDPESEGYSWDDAQMFRDLEAAERLNRQLLDSSSDINELLARLADEDASVPHAWHRSALYALLAEVRSLRAAAMDAEVYWSSSCTACGRSRKEPSSTCSFARLDVASYHAGRFTALGEVEAFEVILAAARKVITAADLLYEAIDQAHAAGQTFPLRVSTTGALFQRERALLADLEVKPK
jgi:hypothetical protein